LALGNSYRCLRRLHVVLAAALLAGPSIPAPAVAAPASGDEQRAWTAPLVTRFSDLAEVTTANVSGLLPLVAQSAAAVHEEPQPDSSGAIDTIDVSLQRFVEERARLMGLRARAGGRASAPGRNIVVSYLVGGGGEEPRGRSQLVRRELRAWDPVERQVLWSVHEALPISSGTLVTAGGLVFYGTDDGWLKALDARSGRMLWKHRVDGRKLEQPVSYRGADGHQYIAVCALPRTSTDSATEGSATVLLFALAH
jgi:hypothetical protein